MNASQTCTLQKPLDAIEILFRHRATALKRRNASLSEARATRLTGDLSETRRLVNRAKVHHRRAAQLKQLARVLLCA